MVVNRYHGKHFLRIQQQSWMKMLPKMDVATSSFKKKPFKALAIIVTNTPPSPQKTKIEFSLDHFFP